jgi:hypothetical protein
MDEDVTGFLPTRSDDSVQQAQVVLYGGASGGRKSNWLVADSAQEYDNPYFRGILLRQSYSEMTNLMDEMEKIYRPLGARSSEGRKLWRFPAGGQMRLGYAAIACGFEPEDGSTRAKPKGANTG